MAHEVETMAYRGATPWHGLGVRIDGIATVDEMRSAAGLDWEVSEQSLFTAAKVRVKGWKCIMRNTDGHILSVATDDYHPVSVKALFDFFRRYAEAGDMEMETAGSLRNGKVIWALAKIKAGEFTVNGRDLNQTYLLMSNGYEPGFAMQLDLTSVRVVCMNTMRMARNAGADVQTRWKHRHDTKFDGARENEARAVVENARKAAALYRESAEILCAAKCDKRVMDAFVVELLQPDLAAKAVAEAGKIDQFGSDADILAAALDNPVAEEDRRIVSGDAGKRLLDEILAREDYVLDPELFKKPTKEVIYNIDRQPGASMGRGTMWQALNAVTYTVDHKWGRTPDTRLNEAWYGERATLKESALELAVEYAQRLGVAA